MLATPMTEKDLMGKLWFSKKQYKILRDRGRDRTFAKLILDSSHQPIGGRVVEYTELISEPMLEENPADMCPFDDAVYLGYGSFSHFMDLRGNEY